MTETRKQCAQPISRSRLVLVCRPSRDLQGYRLRDGFVQLSPDGCGLLSKTSFALLTSLRYHRKFAAGRVLQSIFGVQQGSEHIALGLLLLVQELGVVEPVRRRAARIGKPRVEL